MPFSFREAVTPFPLPASREELRVREARAVDSLRKGWRWPEGETPSFYAWIQSHEESLLDWVRLEAMALRLASDTIIVSLVSKEYARLGANWLRHVDRLGLRNAILIAGDEPSHAFFRERGAACVRAHLPSNLGGGRSRVGFTPKGLMMATLKFLVCRKMLQSGYHVVFSDIDALWLRDPIPILKEMAVDLAYQSVYAFPEELVRAWGHAVCSGFFYLRKHSPQALAFIASCEGELSRLEDDQIAMNVALAGQSIAWRYPEPERTAVLASRRRWIGSFLNPFKRPWIVCGLTKVIHGISESSGLRVAALPQVFARRHVNLEIPLGDAYILHPNSPKDERGKLDAFRRLGLRMSDESA